MSRVFCNAWAHHNNCHCIASQATTTVFRTYSLQFAFVVPVSDAAEVPLAIELLPVARVACSRRAMACCGLQFIEFVFRVFMEVPSAKVEPHVSFLKDTSETCATSGERSRVFDCQKTGQNTEQEW